MSLRLTFAVPKIFRFPSFPRTWRHLSGRTLCLLLLLAEASALGGPLDEMHSLAQLSAIDLARLKRGQIVMERWPSGDFPRGIYLESCYFIHAPLSVVGDAMLHWEPSRHKILKIRLYREFSLLPAADAFETVQLIPTISDDKWLLERTARVVQGSEPDGLHLTNEEADFLRQEAAIPSASWQKILRRRSEALARGGLAAVAPYKTDNSITPASEFRGLLTLAPKAARHFQPITTAQPMTASGKPASEAVAYWEAANVRDHTTLQLGVLAAQKTPDSWQLINCVYYPSDTYFMTLNLFQLWPMEGGTLVWQVGFVSAPFRSYLGGIDRYVAAKLMMQQTIDTITAFRADVEKGARTLATRTADK